eukprot:scaffold256160_cov16-Prasinocladus_malaysianus.AAC.3
METLSHLVLCVVIALVNAIVAALGMLSSFVDLITLFQIVSNSPAALIRYIGGHENYGNVKATAFFRLFVTTYSPVAAGSQCCCQCKLVTGWEKARNMH